MRTKELITFNGTLLNLVITTIIKYGESLILECYSELSDPIISISMYDNDGSFINFDKEVYNPREIKRKIRKF